MHLLRRTLGEAAAGNWAWSRWDYAPGQAAQGIYNKGVPDALDHIWANWYEADSGIHRSACLARAGSGRPNWLEFPTHAFVYRVTWRPGQSCGGWGWPEHSGAVVNVFA
ncbi:hypothetical protein GCM10022248_90450 [Nonomuraea soli]